MPNYGPRIFTDGLVLCLDAANSKSYPTSGTAWTNLSANNNNGSLYNGPVFSSENIGSLAFDGVDDIVFVGQSPYELSSLGTNDVTINVWSKITTSDGTERQQFSNSARGNSIYRLGYLDNKMYSLFYGATGDGSAPYQYSFPVYGTTTLPTGTWIMTTTVMDRSSDIKLYLNGELEPTTGSANISSADGIYFEGISTFPVCVGGMFLRSPFRLHQGNISSVQLYFKPLSAEEVRQNYNATKGRFKL
jgi:hypothetical protein